MTKIYVTSSAFSKGIEELDAELIPEGYAQRECARIKAKWGYRYIYEDDYHLTREAAIARAEEMRTKRLVLLRKQIERLERMTFK